MLRDESTGSNPSEPTWGQTGRADEVRRVHDALCAIARRRAAADAEEMSLLRDAKELALWRDLGYATIFEYLEAALGYGPRTAHDRLRVAAALEDLPVMDDALSTGRLNYSAVRELTRVATRTNEERWIDRA